MPLARTLLPLLALWLVCGFHAMCLAEDVTDLMESGTVRIISRTSRGIGTGSGFVVGDGSYVVTNYHVVADASAVEVHGDSLHVPVASVVASSPQKDLAVLRLHGVSGRKPLSLALRSSVHKTQTVLAAGFPGAADELPGSGPDGLFQVKFTKGIISAFVQDDNQRRLYQIDAPINPGNSGGPLFDECGRVVGINVAKSLKYAIVLGPDGRPTAERVPFGEGVAWAIQADELLSLMQAAGLDPAVDTRACNAASNSNVKSIETSPVAPTPTNLGLYAALGLAALALSVSLTGRGRGAIQTAYQTVALGRRSPQLVAAPLQPVARHPEYVHIRGLSGSMTGTKIPVGTDPIAIGRDPRQSHIVFDAGDNVVSKRHCIIRFDVARGGVTVEDCGSRNGTFVDNGERLMPGQPRLLARSGRFYLGDKLHLFEVG